MSGSYNLDGHFGMAVVCVMSLTPHFTPSVITPSNIIQAYCQIRALRCDIIAISPLR